MIIISNFCNQKSVDLVKIKRIRNRYFVLKNYTLSKDPISILNELKILNKLRHPNLLLYEACALNERYISLIFPYLVNNKFKDIYLKLNIQEIKIYMKNLFMALEYLHKNNIIHGDIKPDNFLYDHENKKFKLIDFENAQNLDSLRLGSYLNGTPGYIAPEILLCHKLWSPSVDMWGTSIIFASFMSGCYPFFNIDNTDYQNMISSSLIQTAIIIGMDELTKFAKKISINVATNIKLEQNDLYNICIKLRKDVDTKYILMDNDIRLGCTFLKAIIVYDPEARLSASEALCSPFLL